MPTVLCNAGPLMALGKLNRLDLLAELYGEVQITRAVYYEVVAQGLVRGAPDALTVQLFWQRQQWPIVDVPPTVLSAYKPPVTLDPGETEVLALMGSHVLSGLNAPTNPAHPQYTSEHTVVIRVVVGSYPIAPIKTTHSAYLGAHG